MRLCNMKVKYSFILSAVYRLFRTLIFCTNLEEFPNLIEINSNGNRMEYTVENRECIMKSENCRFAFDHNMNTRYIVRRIPFCDITEDTLNEISYLTTLNHDSIVKFCGQVKINDYNYFVCEYPGQDLKTILKTRNVTYEEFLLIIKQILDFINYLKAKNIALFNLNYRNILVTESWKIKIHDFSLVIKENTNLENIEEAMCHELSTLFGSLPPDVTDRKEFNHKTAVWFLGKVLEECVKIKKFNNSITDNNLKNLSNLILYFTVNDIGNRPSADIALLHPYFDFLYNFMICFGSLSDFSFSKDGNSIVKKEKILFYNTTNYSYTIYCCCNQNKSIEFTYLNQTLPNIFVNSTTTPYISKLLNYKIQINTIVYPLQHLNTKNYNEIKDLFTLIANKNLLKEKKETIHKKVLLSFFQKHYHVIIAVSIVIILFIASIIIYIKKRRYYY
ncbi:protein tyrosine kinase [Hamiltosporidium magnivora]|uniref:Protein tyrosine kinase n=1 Tax=Hamiltosporidium magnivora TaxID=148818 RepID=A0A4Q9KZN2_9MICR|nr:protein tyrosine kinase [Hamiltosporidium magnivora]